MPIAENRSSGERETAPQRYPRAVPQTIHRAKELLTRYESLWRARAAAIEDILSESPHHVTQADARSAPPTAPASPPTEGSET